jgi:hypothetical protein
VAWVPSWFPSVMWCGEALCRLGAWGVGVFLLLGGFFLSSVGPASQQDFSVRSSHYLLPPSSCHLGSSVKLLSKVAMPFYVFVSSE